MLGQEFKASLGYVRTCLKTKHNKRVGDAAQF